MQVRTHSTVGEGVVTGLVGAIAVAVWYLVADAAAGAPLRTPNMLGQIFFGTGRLPSARPIEAGPVLGYTVLHFLMFILIGIVLTGLVHLVSRRQELRMGLWLAFVLAFAWLCFHIYLLTPLTGDRAPPWVTMTGAVVGVAALALFLWYRHPRLRRSLAEVPLGDETETPPAPRGPPAARS
jgi:hypothetical protein